MMEQLAYLGAEYEADPNNVDTSRRIGELYERLDDYAIAEVHLTLEQHVGVDNDVAATSERAVHVNALRVHQRHAGSHQRAGRGDPDGCDGL